MEPPASCGILVGPPAILAQLALLVIVITALLLKRWVPVHYGGPRKGGKVSLANGSLACVRCAPFPAMLRNLGLPFMTMQAQ